MHVGTIMLVVIGLGLAVWGLFTLTQATLGAGLLAAACFFGILARLSQAAHYQGQFIKAGTATAPFEATPWAAFIARPDGRAWPPAPGSRLTVPTPLALRVAPDQSAKRAGFITPNMRLVVVTIQGNWLFVQTEDELIEGWAETTT
jgi:hypothetical protein